MIWFMLQGRSSIAYSIQIEIFVIMLSIVRLSLSISCSLHLFLWQMCTVLELHKQLYVWLTKSRFISSITWCLKRVIDKFVALGRVEVEELYSACSGSCSMHMQFNYLSVYAVSLKLGIGYLQAMCPCSYPHQTPNGQGFSSLGP